MLADDAGKAAEWARKALAARPALRRRFDCWDLRCATSARPTTQRKSSIAR